MEKLETELASLRARAETLATRHAAADAALVDAKSKLQRHHLETDVIDADDKTRVKLEAAVASCAVTLTGYADALIEVGAKIADIEAKIMTERGAVERKAASEKFARDLDAMEQALIPYLEAGRKFADTMDAIHFHFETVQMAAFLRSTSSQLEVASAFSVAELRSMLKAIADGSAPIPPKPEQPAPVVPVERPAPTKVVFMMHSAWFTDHDGRRRFAGQWTDQALPLPIADRALRHGVAVLTTHPMRSTHLGMRGSDYVSDGPDVVDLDKLDDRSGAKFENPNDPVAQANFIVLDRSREARKIAVAGPSIL
jgi:hypothetical protein